MNREPSRTRECRARGHPATELLVREHDRVPAWQKASVSEQQRTPSSHSNVFIESQLEQSNAPKRLVSSSREQEENFSIRAHLSINGREYQLMQMPCTRLETADKKKRQSLGEFGSPTHLRLQHCQPITTQSNVGKKSRIYCMARSPGCDEGKLR